MAKYDILTLSRNFFPWFWQTDTNMSLVDVLQSVFNSVNDAYSISEADFTQRVGYSIQRLSLEEGLNDRYDLTLRRIQVINGDVSEGQFIFNEAEVLPVGAFEVYIYNEAETPPGDFEDAFIYNEGENPISAAVPFTVSAPLSLSGQEQEIRAYIEAVLIESTEYNLIFA